VTGTPLSKTAIDHPPLLYYLFYLTYIYARLLVNRFSIFFIRAIVGAVFAVLLVRMFYPDKAIVYSVALAVFIIGMAYFFEYVRKNKTK
jgi:hypothetical protein